MFLKEIGSWMADPKLPPSVQERWFDIWERVDPGITSKVGSIAVSMFSRVQQTGCRKQKWVLMFALACMHG